MYALLDYSAIENAWCPTFAKLTWVLSPPNQSLGYVTRVAFLGGPTLDCLSRCQNLAHHGLHIGFHSSVIHNTRP